MDKQTNKQRNIYSIFRDKLSLPEESSDCLLHAFFGVNVEHPYKAVLHLHRPDTSTVDVLPKCKVQPAPECPILLLLNDCKDLVFSNLILLFLSCFKALVEMLPAVPFSMLATLVALLLAYLQTQLNIFNRELEQSVDLTLVSHTFKIPPNSVSFRHAIAGETGRPGTGKSITTLPERTRCILT
jgi:hypothetical protein